MSAKHTLLVANYAPDVGYAWWLMERFWIQIAEAAEANGTRAYLAYPRMGPVPPSIADSPAIPVECDFSPRGVLHQGDIVSLVRESGIESVYLTDKLYLDPRYAVWRSAGVKRIVVHDHTPGDRPPVTGLKGAAKSVANRFGPTACDLWIAISPLMRERALRTTRVPDRRCIVVQNGIDPESPGAGARAASRAELDLCEDTVAIVSVGRASRYKNLDFLVDVGSAVRDRGLDDVVFLHIGDGPDLEDFRARAAELGLDRRVRFLGRRADVPSLLEGFDAAFHPSKGEGFSLAILEYMRAGLPVVVPDRPSVCQAIVHESSGLVYSQGDVESAAAAVQRLAGDAAARRAMGARAADDVRTLYPWERTEAEFSDVTRYLVRGGALPRTVPWKAG